MNVWQEALPARDPRPALEHSTAADVVIVGAGFTGLWTAYYLGVLAPHLEILVVEAERVGFGASGRNGGWVGGGIAGSAAVYRRNRGAAAVLAAIEESNRAVDEVGRVAAAEGIDCGYRKAGTIEVATTEPQRARLQAWADQAGEQLLTPDQTADHVRIPGVRAGHFTPHCASVNPALLAEGLARACERRGVRILEGTRALQIEPRLVRTDHGAVRAPVVLRCTESYTTQLPGLGRRYLPLTSLMIATEPLSADQWDEIGAAPGLTIEDRRHLFFYAQRTADDRIAIGGRGAPYTLRDPMDPARETNPQVRQRLVDTLHRHFPAARGAAVTHHWGGTLAVPRDWSMGIEFDPATGFGSAGGYSGHGLGATNISGRTLADLVLRRPTDLTRLPWVGHRSRSWEPEPLRYLASWAIVRITGSADVHEDSTDRTARRTRLVAPFLPPG